MLCPNCRSPLGNALSCANGHRFREVDGILVLVSDAFGARLREFLPTFSQTRHTDGKRILDVAAYAQLPYGPGGAGHFEWRLRQYDLTVIESLFTTRPPGLRILDVGAWNGWLSHRLAALGHAVTGVDYFTDEFDGLGAHKFYPIPWRTVQMDLTDLDLLDETYDVVILNRCLAFFDPPAVWVSAALRRVAPDGLLLATGLQFYKHPAAKARSVAANRQAHLARAGFDLFLYPTKGYLDFDDRASLEQLGLRLHAYPQLRWADWRARLDMSRPLHRYGLWYA